MGVWFSGIVDQTNVVGDGVKNIVGGSEGGFSLSFQDVWALEDAVGGLEGVLGILDFSASVWDFAVAFGLLGVVNFIVPLLFLGDGSLESVQNTLDGVKWASGLDLVLDLHHDTHDVSLGGEVQGVLLDHTCVGDGE